MLDLSVFSLTQLEVDGVISISFLWVNNFSQYSQQYGSMMNITTNARTVVPIDENILPFTIYTSFSATL